MALDGVWHCYIIQQVTGSSAMFAGPIILILWNVPAAPPAGLKSQLAIPAAGMVAQLTRVAVAPSTLAVRSLAIVIGVAVSKFFIVT